MKRVIDLIKALILCTVVFSCPLSALGGEIVLSAAASLRESITELADFFSKDSPGVIFLKNSGASGALAKQIENGSPTDIFISANLEWMDYLKEKGLVGEKNITILAYNALVFIGKRDQNLKTLKDLSRLEKIAIGSPGSVPAGEYAISSLNKTGMTERLRKKFVMAKDVRECLMYAERGEVDGAFVYRTDTLEISDRLKILFEVPQELYPRVTYPMGLTTRGTGNEDAKAFFKFLQTQDAKAILIKYGFIIE